MCRSRSSKKIKIGNKIIKVDNCIAPKIELLHFLGVKTLACCCGHQQYPMSIVIEAKDGRIFDLISAVEIPRKVKFYITDRDGYKYIPEVVENGYMG